MFMKISVRFASESDIPAIMDLLHQVNDVHADGRPDLFVHGQTKYGVEELTRMIPDRTNPIFVGLDSDGHIVGYCFCVVEDHSDSNNMAPVKTLYIDDLCVDRAHRGMHVGHEIFNFVKEYAREQGFYNITLNVWSCNPGAMKFYESVGLKPLKIGMETIL